MSTDPSERTGGIVTAVVLTWRDTRQTEACARTLLESPHIGRVIVVDNESSGTMRPVVAGIDDPRVSLLEQSRNLGFSGGVNAGLRAAQLEGQDFVLVINNDAVIAPSSLGLLVAGLLADPAVDLVAPRIIGADGSDERSWGSLTRGMALDRAVSPSEADYFTWACVLFRKDLLARVGYLDEQFFMYWEDVDFGRRMKRLGLVSRLIPLATVGHRTSSSHARAGSVIDAYSCHGLTVLARKEGRLFWGLTRTLGRAAKRLARGDFRGSTQCLRGAWLALSHAGASGASTFA